MDPERSHANRERGADLAGRSAGKALARTGLTIRDICRKATASRRRRDPFEPWSVPDHVGTCSTTPLPSGCSVVDRVSDLEADELLYSDDPEGRPAT
jgi:hypothetical protein